MCTPSNTRSFSKEELKKIQQIEKVAYIQKHREMTTDKFIIFKNNKTHIFIAASALLSLLLKYALVKVKNPIFAGLAVFCLIFAFINYYSAPRRTISVKGEPIHFPIIGSTLQILKHRADVSSYLLQAARATSFESFQISCIGGLHGFVPFEERDLTYVLKGNWTNYLKNLETDLSSFEFCMAEMMGRGVFAVDGKEWEDQRKIASHMFSVNGLKRKTEHVFTSHGKKACAALDQYIIRNPGKSINIQEFFQCVVFDAFTEIAFGVNSNSLQCFIDGVPSPFQHSFDRMQQICGTRFLDPPAAWQLARLLQLTNDERELLKHKKITHSFIEDIIKKRRDFINKTGDYGDDLISLYFEHAKKTNQSHIATDDYLRDTILNFIIAGRDTTSCTMTNMIKLLGLNADVKEKLSSEYSTIKDNSWDEIKKLSYADGVFNEILRLYPPVSNDFRICQKDDVLPSGMKVLKGGKVLIPALAIGRSPKIYSEPNQFKPERWLNAANSIKKNNEYQHPVFWGGPRVCLGRDMARYEAKVLTKILLENFDFKPLNCSADLSDPVNFATGPVIFYRHGLQCQISKK